MINAEEEKLISENVIDYYHLVDCNTHVFGEPFLDDNYLYYFDGEVITLVLPKIKERIDKKSLNDVIGKIIKKHSPENLIVWGETPTLEINEQEGYKLDKENLELFKREIVFKTSDFVPSSKYRNYLNKAKREGLTLNPVKLDYYKADYTRLLLETHKGILGIKSLAYYVIFPNVKRTKYFEIFKGEKMVSVNIVIEAFPNYVCFAEIGYDKSFKNASGFSKALLIDYYLDKTNYISWGGCSNQGIFNFKKELLGETPICFYNNYIWYEFYKEKPAKWWLMKMEKG